MTSCFVLHVATRYCASYSDNRVNCVWCPPQFVNDANLAAFLEAEWNRPPLMARSSTKVLRGVLHTLAQGAGLGPIDWHNSRMFPSCYHTWKVRDERRRVRLQYFLVIFISVLTSFLFFSACVSAHHTRRPVQGVCPREGACAHPGRDFGHCRVPCARPHDRPCQSQGCTSQGGRRHQCLHDAPCSLGIALPRHRGCDVQIDNCAAHMSVLQSECTYFV
jgi:hypothetical protein